MRELTVSLVRWRPVVSRDRAAAADSIPNVASLTAFYLGGLSLLACHCRQDTAGSQVSIAQLLFNVARSEDEHTIGDLRELIYVGGEKENACPISAGAAKLRMQFGSRRYVNTGRWVIEQEQFGSSSQPARNDCLLLIAPGQSRDLRLGIAAESNPIKKRFNCGSFSLPVDEQPSCVPGKCGETDVEFDGVVRKGRKASVAGEEPYSCRDGGRGFPRSHIFPAMRYRATGEWERATNCQQELARPRARN